MKSNSKNEERQFLLPITELIDKLTIDQIKEVLMKNKEYSQDFSNEIIKLEHDIDLIINERNLKLSSRMIRIIIIISQMNLHIWYNKDKMQNCSKENYNEFLKLAHQLNGIRNQMKNLLLEETGDKEKSFVRTNFNTDGLEWRVSIK